MDLSLQLFSIRDLCEADFDRAIRLASALGYTGVEFAGFFGRTADEIRGLLEDNGLTAVSAHGGPEGLEPDAIGASIDFWHTIGCTAYTVPGADLSRADKLDAFIRTVNAAQPILRSEGIELHYHNHAHEFFPNTDGQYIHRELQQRTSLLFEVDTYWVYHAGLDPIGFLDSLRDRVRLIHLKDGTEKADGFPLGRGTAPVRHVYRYAVENGLTVIVESETLNPDGPTEAAECMAYLHRLQNESDVK